MRGSNQAEYSDASDIYPAIRSRGERNPVTTPASHSTIQDGLGASVKSIRSESVAVASGLSQYPRWLLVPLILVLAGSPIPVASNRPEYWMLWAAILLITLALYLGGLALRGKAVQAPLRAYPILGTLAVAFIVYSFLQTLPLPFLDAEDGEPRTISIVPDATMLAAIRWTSYAIFFFLCLQVAASRRLGRTMGWAAFFVVGIHCIYALVSFQYFGDAAYLGPAENAYADFVTGTFINRNSFATFAGMGFLVGLALLLRDALETRRPGANAAHVLSAIGAQTGLLWLLLIIIFISIVASASRMGIVATTVGGVAVVFLVLRKYSDVSRTALLRAFLLLAVLFAISLFLFGDAVLKRSIFLEAEFAPRIHLYVQTVELIASRPLLGFGLDSFEIAIQHVHRPPVSPDYLWDRAHSTYLSLWSESGLIFGSLPALIVGIILARLILVDLKGSGDHLRAIIAIGVIVQTGLHSLVDFSLEMPANVFLFVFLIATAAARRPDRTARRSTARP